MLSNFAFGSLILSSKLKNNFEESKKILDYVFDSGIKVIDTANVYGEDISDVGGNEKLLSKIVNNSNSFIMTKGGCIPKDNKYISFSEPEFLIKSAKESIKNLNKNKLDLFQLHGYDYNYPLNEVAKSLNKMKEDGLSKEIGLSNIEISELLEIQKQVKIYSIQNMLNPIFNKDFKNHLIEYCEANNIIYFAYGVFNGINKNLDNRPNRILNEISNKYNTSSQMISLAWIKSKSSNIIPIISSTNIDNIKECLDVNKIILEKNDIEEIDNI